MSFWQLNTIESAALATDRAALKALDTSNKAATLVEDGFTFRRTNSDMSATLTNLSVTSTSVDSGTETITKTAHGFRTGDAVIATTAVNGLSVETIYYVIASTADTFKLASSFLDARAGTAINLTGTTNFTVKRLVDPLQGVYVVSTGHSLDGSNGAWVREYSGRADVRWFGAVGDYPTTDSTHALQACSDLSRGVFVPDGQYKITKTWLLDDYAEIHFESRNAVLRTAETIDMMAGRGTNGQHHTPYRNLRVSVHSGFFVGPAARSGGTAMNWESFTFVKVFGTEIGTIQNGIKNGGPNSLGAYYNDFYGVDISSVNIAVSNGTLANHINFFGGRSNDMLIGTEDYDNTDVTYWGFSTETYDVCGARVSHTGQASQRIRYMGGRYENLSVVAQTAGIVIGAAAQNTVINAPWFSMAGAVDISDSGTSTVITAPYV